MATPLEGKVAFILEDDVNNLAIISSILSRIGMTVHFDTWGTETPYQIKKFMPIDIILLDMMLPRGVSGYDIFDEIRVTPGLENIPIVAVTAMDPGTEMNKAKSKGFSGYLSKPIRTRSFARAIAAVLNGEEVWGEVD
jgi:CheY-like chemotaxis protein